MVSMQTRAALFTALFMAGFSWADCRATDPSDSNTLPPASRQLLRDTGYRHFYEGQYQKALACYTEALRASEAHGSQNTSAIASDLNDIAILSEEMGRYADARRYFARELDVLTPSGDAAGTAIGQTYMELGGLSLIEGSLSE